MKFRKKKTKKNKWWEITDQFAFASATSLPSSEKPPPSEGQISVDIRMCRECKTTLFAKRDFAASIAHKPPDQRAYETLRQFERGIRQLLPGFQRTVLALQPPSPTAGETGGGGGGGAQPRL